MSLYVGKRLFVVERSLRWFVVESERVCAVLWIHVNKFHPNLDHHKIKRRRNKANKK